MTEMKEKICCYYWLFLNNEFKKLFVYSTKNKTQAQYILSIFQLKLKQSSIYIVSGLLMIGVFFVFRICIFPFLYWQYSRFADIPFLDVPATIPLKCNFGCSLILVLQIYFMYLMIRGACRVFYKIYKSKALKGTWYIARQIALLKASTVRICSTTCSKLCYMQHRHCL